VAIRTSQNTVTFSRPFVLSGLDEMPPAGTYSVETDEELLESNSFPAYRRILAVIRLHPKRGRAGVEWASVQKALSRQRL
jgi:hypothetical protein